MFGMIWGGKIRGALAGWTAVECMLAAAAAATGGVEEDEQEQSIL